MVPAASQKQRGCARFDAHNLRPRFELNGRMSRAPIDLVAVVDRSGSMKGEKMALVIETIRFVTKQLKERDRFSLVTYDTNVTVDLPLREMSAEARAVLERKVSELKAGSSTNLSGGLMAGIEQLLKRTARAEVASVLVFTDGLANYGVTSAPQLVTMMSAALSKVRSPVTVFTFGFGKDHSEKMLRALADAARGFYYYIEVRMSRRFPDAAL